MSDAGLQTAPYTPDFSQISNVLQTKERQYQQGEAEVASGYSAIASQPVTGMAAQNKKQEYLKSAQDGLRKVATTDLSLGKNTAQAQQLYAPFYEDNTLMMNVGLTKYYDQQDSKLDGWENSNDLNIRSTYNVDARNALQIKRQELADTPFDRNAYNKHDKLAATPFYDINADVDKAYKEEQIKGVDNTTLVGGGVYTIHNGVKSLDSFRNYYLSKVGDKYNAQLRVSAYVSMYKDKQDIISKHPDLDPAHVDEYIAEGNINALASGYRKNRDSYGKIAEYWTKRANDILAETRNGQTADNIQKDSIKKYQQEAKDHQEQANEYDGLYKKVGAEDPNTKEYQDMYKEMHDHPLQYIAQINRQRQADAWATGMAYMNTSETVTLNPVIDAYIKHQEKNAELALQDKQINVTAQGQVYNLYKETGMTHPGGPQDPRYNTLGDATHPRTAAWKADYPAVGTGSNENPVGPNGLPNPTMFAAGTNTTSVANLPPDYVQQQQQATANGITNDVYGEKSGLSGSLQIEGVLTPLELSKFNHWATSSMTGGKPSIEDAAIVDKVKSALRKEGIDESKIRGPLGMQNALIEYTTKVAERLKETTIGDNLPGKHAQGIQLATTAMQMQQRMMLYNKNQEEYTKAQLDMFKNPLFSKLAVTDPNTRNVRAVTPKDIENGGAPELVLEERNPEYDEWNNTHSGWENREFQPFPVRQKVYTREQFAKDWYDGKIKSDQTYQSPDGRATITVDGKTYTINSINGRDPDANLLRHIYDPITNQFGKSGYIREGMNAVNKVVNSRLNMTKDGVLTPRQGVDPHDPNYKKYANSMGREMGEASIVPVVYYDQVGEGNILKEAELEQVRHLVKSSDDLDKNGVGIYTTNTPDGKPAYEIEIKSTSKLGDPNNSETAIKHKKYIFPVTSLNNAPVLAAIPHPSASIYDDLDKVNRPISSDPISEKMGNKFQVWGVEPGADGKATIAVATMEYDLPDPNNSGKILHYKDNYKIPKTGPSAKTNDEIMQFMYNRVQSNMIQSDAILKNIQKANASNAQYRTTENDIQKYQHR